MSWSIVDLNTVCRPRQWKTLSMDKLTDTGYPVYGANGKIGFYSEYTHEQPTLAITCRGATCGNVHITDPKSYINGNAMALDNLSNSIDLRFLYYYFIHRGFSDVISGSAQPQITGEGLSKIQIPLPPLPIQKRIAEILDAADALRKKDQELLKKYDELAQAIFIDMFGDPVKNEKGWEVKTIQEVTDNYDSFRKPVKSSDREKLQGVYPYYGATGIIDSVNEFLLDGEFLLISEDGKNLVGRYKKIAFIADGKFWVNNHAHVLKAKENSNNYYLEFYLNRFDLSPFVTGIDQFKLNRSNLDIVPVLVPPKKQQEIFELLVKDIEHQKRNTLKQIENSARLFHTIIQKAFSGELVS